MLLPIRAAVLAAALLVGVSAPQAFAATLYSQGFETNAFDWNGATRVSSGTDGVPSSSGAFHAQTGTGYTFWGGFNASNGGSGSFVPYTTSIDIYLNIAGGAANDTRFDFTSSIYKADNSFLRDFIFNAGFYNSGDVTNPGAGTNRFIVSASNNAPGWPANPDRDPIVISQTGWYTFQEQFFDNGGVLGVNLSILDSSESLLGTWLLSDPTDLIGTVGGSGYGWFATNGFGTLNIDNASLTTDVAATPLPATLPMFVSGLGLVGLLRWRRTRKPVAA